MRSEVIKPIIMVLSLLLMVTYLGMNGYKLKALPGQWEEINASTAAPRVQLMLADELVYQQRLKSSELFDAAGQRQISFIHLPKNDLVRIKAQIDAAKLIVGGQAVSLSALPDKSILLAVIKDQLIYLLANDDLKSMILAIWQERHKANNFIQCMNAGLCESLRITSKYWGQVDGPYLDTELRSDRRNMPRGRWTLGPTTVLDIQSEKKQKVLAMISLQGLFPDQRLAFKGAAVAKVQKVKGVSRPLSAGGKTLYPASYVVLLDLQPGANTLEIIYSKWTKPRKKGDSPLAVYMTAVKLKLLEE